MRLSDLPKLTSAVLTVAAVGLSPLAYSQVYKVTDDENGVVFTDRPNNVGNSNVERVDIREPNTASPPPSVPAAAPSRPSEPEAAPEPEVAITSPANESTIAMGPGNFSVSAQASPPLSGGEQLLLLMDGQAIGAAQSGSSWFVEGALRGPHDLVVQRLSRSGQSLAVSEPVRIYVLRPSVR